MELKKELQERPTRKLVDDLKKKVQILQVLATKVLLRTAIINNYI
jgi:hypothetical protein